MPNRTLLDHARDVEQLAEGLKVDKFGVMVCCFVITARN